MGGVVCLVGGMVLTLGELGVIGSLDHMLLADES